MNKGSSQLKKNVNLRKVPLLVLLPPLPWVTENGQNVQHMFPKLRKGEKFPWFGILFYWRETLLKKNSFLF